MQEQSTQDPRLDEAPSLRVPGDESAAEGPFKGVFASAAGFFESIGRVSRGGSKRFHRLHREKWTQDSYLDEVISLRAPGDDSAEPTHVVIVLSGLYDGPEAILETPDFGGNYADLPRHVSSVLEQKRKGEKVVSAPRASIGGDRSFDGSAAYDRDSEGPKDWSIKYVFPIPPKRTMEWPGGAEEGVRAYYTYKTDMNGKAEEDKIIDSEMAGATAAVLHLIERETVTLRKSEEKYGPAEKRVILAGCSQGGTVAINAVSTTDEQVLAALVPMRTIAMSHSDRAVEARMNNDRNAAMRLAGIPVYWYKAQEDDVYPGQWSEECFGRWVSKGKFEKVERCEEPGLTHEERSEKEVHYLAAKVVETFLLRG
uniref:Phospholipase/carboxylesterase/thioesterase domain-containing protein n=1 Tax=Trieres chinensis TaxID=1514140 RepID=A0A7S2ELS7_TRICV|mmetsp:Transcript_29603/g.60443  ORF Transcript_29603/g.60443 Transcript_29603/m.60443 type:complete len:369 (+) Transcript_29603:121-1227(+)|eukprot:CAMPEP_0183311446 /NCGR_PEP_ID=MMETSP0160_2-20130417/36990_1 /TAXON_ID=2839 ORGANISM="Odontella Sinensis, Strain Grunow 1884" /NCGR_SAMPLE_ID=MMETSP0160_2 /ASSEMBLY_ACC=CAM_ASM_000250 /LENGTH=368 /DNA_ID=CAMNT_0025476019 /DNA_START=29 /DNA_END=1135 /DNA_ORIENTATION=-